MTPEEEQAGGPVAGSYFVPPDMPPYMDMLETCPCCGRRVQSEQYAICPVCCWEDDHVQRRHPYAHGANGDWYLVSAQRLVRDRGLQVLWDLRPIDPRVAAEYPVDPAWRPISDHWPSGDVPLGH
ncbi:MAG TPA: CPCC family cysteine-rich protein [Phycisphaerales bacterium]|nr:CPCC family cysteine-rich protein [Phycisphaerales bacterium]